MCCLHSGYCLQHNFIFYACLDFFCIRQKFLVINYFFFFKVTKHKIRNYFWWLTTEWPFFLEHRINKIMTAVQYSVQYFLVCATWYLTIFYSNVFSASKQTNRWTVFFLSFSLVYPTNFIQSISSSVISEIQGRFSVFRFDCKVILNYR